MCDYSLHHVNSRPAKVGDKLTTRDFGLGTRGFAAPEDENVAVCVLPGTELSFASEVECECGAFGFSESVISHKTAIFRQINQEKKWRHHDALEFPDGEIVLLTFLQEGQQAFHLSKRLLRHGFQSVGECLPAWVGRGRSVCGGFG